MFVLTVIGENWTIFAILLEASTATGAVTAGIDHATHGSQITLFEFLNLATYFRHTTHDFVTWHARVNSIVPLVANLVQIRMTDAAIKYLDLDIVSTNFTSLNREGTQRSRGALRRVGTSADRMVLVAHWVTQPCAC